MNFLSKDPYRLIDGDDIAEVKAMQTEIATATTQLNKLNDDIAKVLSALESVSIDELKNKLSTLSNERDNLKGKIDLLNINVASVQDAENDLVKWFIRTTNFDEGAYGEDVVETIYESDHTSVMISRALKDNVARERLRVMLPSMLGKIIVDSNTRRYAVFNRMGRQVYQSKVFESLTNKSDRWRDSLKKWTKRKTAGGTTIVCKRYQRKSPKSN